MVAKFADRVQLLDFLRFGNQVEDRVEAFAIGGRGEGADDDDFAGVACFLAEFDDLCACPGYFHSLMSRPSFPLTSM